MHFLRTSLLVTAGFIAAVAGVFLVYGNVLRGQVLTSPYFKGQGYDPNYLNRDLPGGPLSPPPFIGIPQAKTATDVPSVPAISILTEGREAAALYAPPSHVSERLEELSARYGMDPDSLLGAMEAATIHPEDMRDLPTIQTALQEAGYQSFHDIPQILVDLDDAHKALDTLQTEHAQTILEQQKLSEENRLLQSKTPRTGPGRILQKVGDALGGAFRAIGRLFGKLF